MLSKKFFSKNKYLSWFFNTLHLYNFKTYTSYVTELRILSVKQTWDGKFPFRIVKHSFEPKVKVKNMNYGTASDRIDASFF